MGYLKKHILTTWFGIKETLKQKRYLVLFLLSFSMMFILLILIPVWSVVGNTIDIQIEIFTLQDYIILALLSSIYALFIAMQVYAMKQRKGVEGVGTAVGGGVGALFAGVAGTAFCASCLAPLFALFGVGFGGVIFVLQYRFYFVAVIAVLMLIAIYLVAKKIERVCKTC